MSRAGVISQARMSSSRLPGKVMLTADGRPFLEHHLDRLLRSGVEVFVATTRSSADDVIVDYCEQRGVPVYRGAEDDVLSRYAGAVEQFGLDVVVRVTSDCPLIDAQLISDGVARFVADGDPDLYLSNTLTRSFPRGFDYEVFSAPALLEANAQAHEAHQREHVTPFLYENSPGRFRTHNVVWDTDKSTYRVTLDTAEDRQLLTRLIEEHGADQLSCREIIEVLDGHPELVALNQSVEQKGLTE